MRYYERVAIDVKLRSERVIQQVKELHLDVFLVPTGTITPEE